MNYNEFYELKNTLSHKVIPELNNNINLLIDMVKKDKIFSFSFSPNIDNQNIGFSRHIILSICLNTESGENIRLGLFDSDKFKNYVQEQLNKNNTKISKNIFKEIDSINKTIFILNDNFQKYIPIIEENSYYSKKFANPDQYDLFKEEHISILPHFFEKSLDNKLNKKVTI